MAFGFGDLQNYTTLKPAKNADKLEKLFWRFTELHYSQTHGDNVLLHLMFWRFTELHYSQTCGNIATDGLLFWRFTELHYSQTRVRVYIHICEVLEIYRITLLSNPLCDKYPVFTVLEIYRITLLSNIVFRLHVFFCCFGDLQNYTTLKRTP